MVRPGHQRSSRVVSLVRERLTKLSKKQTQYLLLSVESVTILLVVDNAKLGSYVIDMYVRMVTKTRVGAFFS